MAEFDLYSIQKFFGDTFQLSPAIFTWPAVITDFFIPWFFISWGFAVFVETIIFRRSSAIASKLVGAFLGFMTFRIFGIWGALIGGYLVIFLKVRAWWKRLILAAVFTFVILSLGGWLLLLGNIKPAYSV